MRVNITKGAFMNCPESTGSLTKCSEWLLSSEPLVLNWTTLMGRSNRRKNSQRKVAEGEKYNYKILTNLSVSNDPKYFNYN